jgi:actin-like ATPase involved in cell morphogenesis
VGPETAERARLDAARSGGTTLPIHVAGRCLQRGTPRLAEVPASLLLADRGELAVAIATAVMRTLERTPVDLAPRVVASGVLLLGGVAATPGLTEPLRQTTALAWMDADPDPAAIARALRSLTQADLLDLS